jgi:hypothetical protein
MHTTLMYLGSALLFCLGALFMRNTHPYAGSRGERFESKQKRKLVGTILYCGAALLLGVALLAQYLIGKG